MTRTYAKASSVPVSRSRGAIDQQLRRWGCTAISWGDDFARETVILRFQWPHGDNIYLARFTIQLRPAADIKAECMGPRGLAEVKYEKALEDRGKQEHRILLLWITASLNAVEAGIVTAEQLFLPYLEDHNGKTVSEVAIPQLAKLLDGSAKRLLTEGDRK